MFVELAQTEEAVVIRTVGEATIGITRFPELAEQLLLFVTTTESVTVPETPEV